jgi:hypothetical protein
VAAGVHVSLEGEEARVILGEEEERENLKVAAVVEERIFRSSGRRSWRAPWFKQRRLVFSTYPGFVERGVLLTCGGS